MNNPNLIITKKKTDITLVVFNIILFFYQFEYFGEKASGVSFSISVFRFVIFPLLFVLLFLLHKDGIKYKDRGPFIVYFIYLLFCIMAIVSYGIELSSLIGLIAQTIQLYVAYAFFQKRKMADSSLFVLTTYSLFQIVFFIKSVVSGNVGMAFRFSGTHYDPNYICMYLLIGFWASIFLLRRKNKIFIKIYLLFTAIFSIIMICASLSRGGFLALGLTSFLYIFIYYRKWFFPIVIILVMLCFYLSAIAQDLTWSSANNISGAVLYRLFAQRNDIQDMSSGRIDYIMNYVNAIGRGEPLILTGIPKYYYFDNYNGGSFVHNFLIEICIQSGLLIGIIFVLSFVRCITKVIIYSLKSKTTCYEIFFFTSGLLVLFFLSSSYKIVWLFFGISYALSNKKTFTEKNSMP